MNAFTIDIDGTKREVIPQQGSKFTFKEIYELIGCSYVEVLSTLDGRYLIVDEEGKLKKDARINVRASLMYIQGHLTQIVGKVFVCKRSMI